MGKLIKGLLGIVALLIVIAVAIPLVIDPNDYKGEITKAAKESTGRELTIDGDLKLSLFPWIGVEMGRTSLSNAAGFGDKPFVAIDEVEVKVKLIPLLSKQVEVSTVVLKGLDLNLAKNSEGVTNWDDLAKPKDSGAPEGVDQKEEESDDSGAALAALAIGGVSIEQANLVWDDRSSGERYEVNDFNIKTGKLAIGEPVDFQMDFGLESAKPKTVAKIDIAAKIIVDSSLQKVTVNGLKLTTDAKGETLPNGAVNLTLLASLVADTAAQQLDVSDLNIHFDETTITGQAAVNNFEKPAITFGLVADRINVDKYLPPAEEGEAPKVVATPATAAAAGGSAVPMQTLRDLSVDGKITIGELLASGLTVSDVALDVKAKDGLINTKQSVGKLYEGSYQGETKLDARGSNLKVGLNEQLKDVQIGNLLRDMSGKDEQISGAANINANLKAVGADPDAIKKTLNGQLEFAVLDGAVHGLNVMQSIKVAQATLKGKSVAPSQDGNKTVFSKLSGSAKVTNGVLKNNDFLLDSSLMQAKGKGTANLVSEELDYNVQVDRVSSSSGELAGKPVALKVSGTFSKPSVNVDLKAMAMEKGKEKINKKAEEAFEKLDKKLPGVGNLLKGFLN